MIQGKLLSIAFKRSPFSVMEEVTTSFISKESGLINDCRGNILNRQITIITEESWKEVCKELNNNLPWTLRRANLLISGINLIESTGKLLHINNVILQITGETKPCKRMEKQHKGLQSALDIDWRGGVTCMVIEGGVISNGDEIKIKDIRV